MTPLPPSLRPSLPPSLPPSVPPSLPPSFSLPPSPQELELTARAHQIPTPSLTPETYKLAEAAEHALGSVTPRSKSPGSANMTPVHMFGSDDLVDILRNSPGMDLSKLQIKQERVRTHAHTYTHVHTHTHTYKHMNLPLPLPPPSPSHLSLVTSSSPLPSLPPSSSLPPPPLPPSSFSRWSLFPPAV